MLSSSYYLSPSYSLPLSLLPLNPPHYSLIPLHSLPHYLSPSFLSHPHYLSPSFFLFSTYLPPCSPLLTTSLPSSFPSYSLPLSLLSLNPPPHYFSSLSPLHRLPHYLSPFFLSFLPTASLPPPPSFLSIHPPHYLSIHPPHYLSPSFLSVILTTSPSFIPFNPPPHYLSSLSCNIIIHLITSVFLPSPSSLLTLPNYLLRIRFSSVVIIILLITSSSLLLFSSFTFVTSSFLSSSFKSPLQYLFHYFLLTISILFHIDSLPNSSPSSSLFYTSSISPSSPSSFYHSPSVLSILLIIFLPSCPLPHTCQLCLPALSKLEFFSLALRKIALSLKCFSHPFLLPPYPFSLHVHACLSYYYHHCWYPLSSTFNYYVFHHIHVYKCTQEKPY